MYTLSQAQDPGQAHLCSATCLGFDSIHGVDKPRSTVSHLEDEIARLEGELYRVKGQVNTISDSAIAAVERLSRCVARATLAPLSCSRRQTNLLSLNSSFFLSGSPVPYLSSQASNPDKLERAEEPSLGTNTLSSIPRHVVDALLKHYCETYRPLYPAVEQLDLYQACDRVYNNADPSGFDIFCVHITMAISMQTLMHKDEKRATTASYGFWMTAAGLLGEIASVDDAWEQLQALQLLAHYAFMNPKNVDCKKCAAAASRLCIHLGLHQELPVSAQVNLDPQVLNTRRRLFWNSYNIDWYDCIHPEVSTNDLTIWSVQFTRSNVSPFYGQHLY
ncbi:hypothetical protein A1O1_08763 [Capronia coronata CBS 617.96]|uniref:Xylanolytic transcriptional activator regulatory domain-containing protein n=1 Tax=Capronia coronata CBS 617.96 TaxID=1182541 RepID=W9YAV1_9EURO|nr:uncharacterized protein A1O1_08763 [Capronia coronata CBS 617.96]EXJ79499.1 hypothetical protein A1O1_08763 [Capronia coronata CBS 617.96]